MRRAILIAIGFVVAAVTSPGDALALDFTYHPNNRSKTLTAILATGEIREGDVEKLKDFLSQTEKRRNTAIYLASSGGNLYEGMNLGLFFKYRRIKTVVEGGQDCASACAIAFLGGTDNSGNPWRSSSTTSRLGFHAFNAPNSGPINPDRVQQIVADMLDYGITVRAPIGLLIEGFRTPSHGMLWLSQKDICALGIKLWSIELDAFICRG
jgi:hypothetical protein